MLAALGLDGRRSDCRTYCLRSWHGRRRTLPLLSGATRSSWLAFVLVQAKAFRPGRIRKGPSIYEMEGPFPASLPRAGQLPGLAGAARRPPGPGTRARHRSPGSSHVPGVAPGSTRFQRWDISTAYASAAQGPAASHFWFLRNPRRNPLKAGSLSAFHGGYPRVIHSLSSARDCAPENNGTAVTGCNRLIFHIG